MARHTEPTVFTISRTLAGEPPVAVLDALELLDGDRLDPSRSRYAKHILEQLGKKGQGQVLNRGELIQDVQGVEYMAPDRYRLEPEWVAVLLASLVYGGDVVLAITGKKFDAGNLDILVTTPIAELTEFKHIERPKEANLAALRALFELLGLAVGMADLAVQGNDGAVQELQIAVGQTVNKLVLAQKNLQDGLTFWGQNLLAEQELVEYRNRLGGSKAFFESLQAYSSPGKLKNFRCGVDEVRAQKAGLEALQEVSDIHGLIGDLSPLGSYLSQAEIVLPSEHALVEKMKETRKEILGDMATPAKRKAAGFRQQTMQKLGELRKEHVSTYATLHTKARLGVSEDKRKVALMQDERMRNLNKLATIDLMPSSQLIGLQNKLAGLRSCFALTESELSTAPVCPHCSFKPSSETVAVSAGSVLAGVDGEMDALIESWTKALLDNLEDPITRENLGLLRPERRKLVDDFLKSRALPDPVSNEFIQALQEALSGLTKVSVNMTDLRGALLAGGSPATPAEMRKRFEGYLDQLTKGKEQGKVRIVLE